MTSPAENPGAAAAPERLRVDLGSRSYDVVVGEGLLERAGEFLHAVIRRRQAVVVTDAHVAALHLDRFAAGLAAAGIGHRAIVLPPGEHTKDFPHFARLAEDILALGIERGTPLVALGGGVVGDITGFAAASLLRGLDFVQVPTTLLAQVDSSVGGKTGINTCQGKNLVGAFHQPVLVLADIGVLATLPRRELLAGYAEVVKYGLIRDFAFYEWLERHAAALLGDAPDRFRPDLLREAVLRSCAAKAAVVAADERETGDRALLNLGHTFGHALEAETGFGEDLLHGESVALGMRLAFDLSVLLGWCPAQDAHRVRRHFAAVGLPVALPEIRGDHRFAAADLLAHMHKDKKVRDGRIGLVLVRGIGDAFVTEDVSPAVLAAFLAAETGG
jgi:3-dehydroquinate synthase